MSLYYASLSRLLKPPCWPWLWSLVIGVTCLAQRNGICQAREPSDFVMNPSRERRSAVAPCSPPSGSRESRPASTKWKTSSYRSLELSVTATPTWRERLFRVGSLSSSRDHRRNQIEAAIDALSHPSTGNLGVDDVVLGRGDRWRDSSH